MFGRLGMAKALVGPRRWGTGYSMCHWPLAFDTVRVVSSLAQASIVPRQPSGGWLRLATGVVRRPIGKATELQFGRHGRLPQPYAGGKPHEPSYLAAPTAASNALACMRSAVTHHVAARPPQEPPLRYQALAALLDATAGLAMAPADSAPAPAACHLGEVGSRVGTG